MAKTPSVDELGALAATLLQPSARVEAAVLLACLGAVWLVVRWLRGPQARPASIWFGRGVVDGVLFPVLALAATYTARRLLEGSLPIAVLRLAVPILLSLVAIRVTARVLHAGFPDSALIRAVERTVSWIAWIGAVLWVTGVLPLLMEELDGIRWTAGAMTISLRQVIEGTLSVVVVLVIALWISAAIEARLLRGAGDNLSLRKIAANATRALLLFVGLLLALSAAGIDLTALGVLGGAVGVGIGFGLQKLAANYVSGFVILAERSLRIGDMVKVDGFEGRITDINTRYTVLRALSGRESIVPNELLITQRVENVSLSDRNLLLTTTVQVAYGTDLDALMPALVQAASDVPRVLADPAPNVLLSAFAADGLELTLQFWIADPENGQNNARSAVNLAVLACLGRHGVEIPYPQRVVHAVAAQGAPARARHDGPA